MTLPSTTVPQFILPTDYELCQTDAPVNLTQYISNYANVAGGTFIVTGNNGTSQVIADFNPMFNPANFPPGTYQIYYGYQIPFECDPIYSQVQTLTVVCCGDEVVDNLNDLECCLYNTNFTIDPQFYGVTYPVTPDRPALVVNGGTPGQVLWTAANNYFTNLGLASPNDPILLDVDLVVPPNVTLLLEGSIHLKFAPNRRILVRRGGLLRINANPNNIDGNVILEGTCNTVWQGIQVEGPGANPTNLQSIPRIAASHNFGVITTNSCEIRDAIIGIAGMALPLMDVNNLQTVISTIPDFNPQNGIFVPSITSLLLHNNYIASSVATSSSGGVVRINNRTIFDRCLQGVNLSWYNNKNVIDPTVPVSRLFEGNFHSTAPLHFPLSFLARSETGVQLHFYANLNIGDPVSNSFGCNFINQTYGIRANEANKIYCYNNDFSSCKVGTSALNAQITGGLNMDIDNNSFTDNLVGIQASGSHISITRNNIGNGSFIDTNNDGIIDQYAIGIFLRGADFEVRNNNINQQLIGTAIMNNGTDINTITDNTFQQMLMGVWAFGDNGTPDNNP
ncbi:MAG TPA: hypothetical protein PK230_10275, partial [Chitinophagales bacterium]|nr:hypothetical protein [Chitinophagales bacterium]